MNDPKRNQNQGGQQGDQPGRQPTQPSQQPGGGKEQPEPKPVRREQLPGFNEDPERGGKQDIEREVER